MGGLVVWRKASRTPITSVFVPDRILLGLLDSLDSRDEEGEGDGEEGDDEDGEGVK